MTKEQLLAHIVAQSAPNKSAQNPLGYCYIMVGTEAAATELHNEELIEAMVSHRQADGSYPCRPTELGAKFALASSKQPPAPAFQPQATFAAGQTVHQPAPQQQQYAPQPAPASYVPTIERGIPVPATKALRRNVDGPTQVDVYPFTTLDIDASFFVPQDNPPKRDGDGKEIPKHRVFSNVVSQANRKFHPKNFVVREWTENGMAGCRVWRLHDLAGPRPVRTRTKLPPAGTPEVYAPFTPGAQGYVGQSGQPFPPIGAGAPGPGGFVPAGPAFNPDPGQPRPFPPVAGPGGPDAPQPAWGNFTPLPENGE